MPESLFKYRACNFIKKEALAQLFSCKICRTFKKMSFYRTPPGGCFFTDFHDHLKFYIFMKAKLRLNILRSSRPEVILRKGVLKITVNLQESTHADMFISIKLLCKFIEITLPHECFPVYLLHIFRTPFSRNTSLWLLLYTGTGTGIYSHYSFSLIF